MPILGSLVQTPRWHIYSGSSLCFTRVLWSMDDCLLAAALSRTPPTCPVDFCDDLTRVGPSTVAAAGHGLFAVRAIGSRMPLYAFTGVKLSEAEADDYPNAYQLMLQGRTLSPPGENVVIDASGTECSPPKFANTRGEYILSDGNNCQFEQFGNHIFFITSRRVQAGEELFTPYGEKTPHWPMTFPGCSKTNKLDFIRCPPCLAVSLTHKASMAHTTCRHAATCPSRRRGSPKTTSTTPCSF